MAIEHKRVSIDSIVTVTQLQVFCEVNGETVILHFGSGNYFGLNDVGTLVWNLIQQPRSVGELRDAIQQEYQVDFDLCERDLINLVGELRERGLIEVRSVASAE